MKLWDKGFSTDKKIDHFTVGNDRELDLHLAKYDVIASKAHAKMLGKIDLLTKEEVKALVNELDKIAKKIENGSFTIEDNFEDIHSKIEFQLTLALGDTGKKIHTARSRNDQVLVAMHLYLKDELSEIKSQTKTLFDLLLNLADKYKRVPLPGYTHLQIAMPSSFGLWFSAYAELLIDDVYVLNAVSKVVDPASVVTISVNISVLESKFRLGIPGVISIVSVFSITSTRFKFPDSTLLISLLPIPLIPAKTSAPVPIFTSVKYCIASSNLLHIWESKS